MIEKHRRDGQRIRIKFVENLLRIISPVKVSDPGVIAPDDKMSAAIILAYDGMKDRLARAGIAHRGGIDRK